MFYWQEVAAERYPGVMFEYVSELYHRLSKEYIAKVYTVSVRLTAATPPEDVVRLVELGEQSLESFYGRAAYAIGYAAYLSDASTNSTDELRRLVERTGPSSSS